MADKQLVLNHQFREVTQHRTGLLPVRCYITTIKHMIHGRLPLHWHEELQWVILLEGEAVFHVHKDRIHLKQGEGLFINSGRMHAAEDIGDQPCVYLCINADPFFLLPSTLYGAYIAPFLTDPRWAYRQWEGGDPQETEIIASLKKVKQTFEEQPPGLELAISKYMSHIWTLMFQDEVPRTSKRSETNEEQTIKTMISWIQRHYAEPIRLGDIATVGLLSRSECCRYFQRVLHTTPLTYVKEYRLQKSMEFLQQSGNSVTAIAFRTGFSSTSHFISTFRAYMRMTPLTYRKRL